MIFKDLNKDLSQLEIVGLRVGLGWGLAKYLHTQSLYLGCGMIPLYSVTALD